jgi:hypothetical protein
MLTGLVATYAAYMATRHNKKTIQVMQEYHKEVNSRMTQLLETIRSEANLQGRADLRSEMKVHNDKERTKE